MGERGPDPKPGSLKALQGNPGKRGGSASGGISPGIASNLKPPSFLPAGAKREWKRIVMQLAGLDLLSDLDVMALAAYCNAFATWENATKAIKADGMTVESPNGYLMPSPHVKIQRDASIEMRAWLREFGMTPAARAKVGGDDGEAKEDDPFAALVARAMKANQRGGSSA